MCPMPCREPPEPPHWFRDASVRQAALPPAPRADPVVRLAAVERAHGRTARKGVDGGSGPPRHGGIARDPSSRPLRRNATGVTISGEGRWTMRVCSVDEMRNLDRRAITEYGIPGAFLMENAGEAVYYVILDEYGGESGLDGLRFAVLCGGGHNGGDGFVVARKLRSS
ncbi:MAG TPA: hypothetical protein ENK19_11465, partial [Acidobacteria bacterium]|nr:hypothetical protein [Acidobacteriota bacterium]